MSFDQIRDWVIGNLAWEILFFIVVTVLFLEFIPALYIAKKILHKNRSTLGNGYGKMRADIFVALWYHDKSFEEKIEQTICNGKNTCYDKVGNIVEKDLQSLKLAEIFEDNKSRNKKVRAIKNRRNYLVFVFTKFYLVHFIGDNSKHYKGLRK